MTTMVDGIAPDVPAIHARWGSQIPVACYVNGIYAWSKTQEASFTRKIRVSVEPGQPLAARVARGLDVERYAARPADVPPFLAERAKISSDGTVYCSLSTVPAVLEHLPDGNLEAVPRWWLAWYWGRYLPPSELEVRQELHRLTGITLPTGRLWACQYAGPLSGGPWDVSIVYGEKDWSR
jgi:hypothetical protein